MNQMSANTPGSVRTHVATSARLLSQFRRLMEAMATAIPELPGLMERSVLAGALALADTEGNVILSELSVLSGLSPTTLDRLVAAFVDLGLVEAAATFSGQIRVAANLSSQLQSELNTIYV